MDFLSTFRKFTNLAAIGAVLATSFCAHPPAARKVPAEVSSRDLFGIWEASGAFVEVVGGRSPDSFSFVFHASRPASFDDLPICVTYDVPLASAKFSCLVPVQTCEFDVTVNRAGGTLTLAASPAPASVNCGSASLPSKLVLSKSNLIEIASQVYLKQEAGKGLPKALVQTIAEQVRSAFVRALRADTDYSFGLQQLVDDIGLTHHRLLARCGALPGAEPCWLGHVREEAESRFKNADERTKDSDGGARVSIDDAWLPVEGPVPRRLDGVWLGPYAAVGVQTGFLEFKNLGNDELGVGFDVSVPYELGDEWERKCLSFGTKLDRLLEMGSTSSTASTALDCRREKSGEDDEKCEMRILLQRRERELMVRPIGRDWVDKRCGATLRGARYYYQLRHSDPFAALVPLLAREGRSTYGTAPEKTAKALAARTRTALSKAGRDPVPWTLQGAANLVGAVQMMLESKCGRLPDAQYPEEDRENLPRCAPSDIDAAVREGVEAMLEREAYFEAEREIDRKARVMPAPPAGSAPSVAAHPKDEDRVTLRVLLVTYRGARNAAAKVTRTREEAKKRASDLRKRQKGVASFEAIVRQYSDAQGSKENGGYMNVARAFGDKSYQPLLDAAFALHPGDTSGPVETEYGFFVIQRLEK